MYKTQGKPYKQIIPELLEPYYSNQQTEITARYEILIPYLVKHRDKTNLAVVFKEILKDQHSLFDIEGYTEEDITWLVTACPDILNEFIIYNIANSITKIKFTNDTVPMFLLVWAVENKIRFASFSNIFFYPFTEESKQDPIFDAILAYLKEISEPSSPKEKLFQLEFSALAAYAFQTDDLTNLEEIVDAFEYIQTLWLLPDNRKHNIEFSRWLTKKVFTRPPFSNLKTNTVAYFEPDLLTVSEKEELLKTRSKNYLLGLNMRASTNIEWHVRFLSTEGVNNILESLIADENYARLDKSSWALECINNKVPLPQILADYIFEEKGHLLDSKDFYSLVPSPYLKKEINLCLEYFLIKDKSTKEEIDELVFTAKEVLENQFNTSIGDMNSAKQIFSILETIIFSEL